MSSWHCSSAGISEVAKVVDDLKAEVQEHAELIIRLLALTPGWKETNFQVHAVPFQNRLWYNGAMKEKDEPVVCHRTDSAQDKVHRLSPLSDTYLMG